MISPDPVPVPADKQTFPQQDVVGWYATGGELTEADMHIQRKVRPRRLCSTCLLSFALRRARRHPTQP